MAIENATMYPVQSSNVLEIGYDPDELELYVRFVNNYLYVYYGVDEDVYNEFLEAPSKGKFVHYNLKNTYEYNRIG